MVVLATIVIEATAEVRTDNFEEEIVELNPKKITSECNNAMELLTEQFLLYGNDSRDLSDTSNVDASINAINNMEWACS